MRSLSQTTTSLALSVIARIPRWRHSSALRLRPLATSMRAKTVSMAPVGRLPHLGEQVVLGDVSPPVELLVVAVGGDPALDLQQGLGEHVVDLGAGVQILQDG